MNKQTVVYTLKAEDHLGFPSLYRLYMEADDVTEYSFATTHLADWRHWELLCASEWFKPYVTAWRNELALRTKARALARIKTMAKDVNRKDALAANKFLLSGWGDKPGKGRPSKEAIKREADRLFTDSEQITEDLRRITEIN